MIGGRIALELQPGLLAELAADRVAACVSGTNGKTTTTRLLVAALATRGPVASNAGGANMPEGHVVALSGVPRDRPAVLEVDEVYLPQVVAAVAPRTIVLLNLSRDQLDRMAETRRIVAAWRAMLVGATERPVVIANADDPLVTWAAMPAGRVVWVGCRTGLALGRRHLPVLRRPADLRRRVLGVRVPAAPTRAGGGPARRRDRRPR